MGARSTLAWGIGIAAIVGATGAGCTGKDPYNPGQSLGTFAVEAHRLSATCGDAQSPPEPWRFDVKLSHDGRRLYWIQGGAPVSGALDDHEHTTMHSEDYRTLRDATKNPTRAACNVRRVDDLDATLDAKSSAPDASGASTLTVNAFHAKLTYRFLVEEGSDCDDVVAAGAFAQLPCEVALDLSGTPKPSR